MKKEKPKEEPSSLFQRQRVDILLSELLRKFPIPQVAAADGKTDEEKSSNANNKNEQNEGTNQESTDSSENVNPQLQKIKQEPQEKRMKM